MPSNSLESYRRSLLPKWVRAFCCLFLLGILAPPVLLVAGAFYKKPMQFTLFGWTHFGSPYDVASLMVLLYFGVCGAAALGLLQGRTWAWHIAFMVGLVGLGLALASLFTAPTGTYRIPFEPLLQIPFLVVLWRIRGRWFTSAEIMPPA